MRVRGSTRFLPTVLVLLTLPLAVRAQAMDPGLLVEYQSIGYFTAPGDLDPIGRNQLLVRPDVEVRWGRWGGVVAELEARGDRARAERNRVYLREARMDLFLGPVDVRVGRTVSRWGRADAVNPTDYFGRWDYRDLLDAPDEPLPQDGITVRWYAGRLSVEAVVVPRFRASRIPTVDARWWPDFPDSLPVPTPGFRSFDVVPADFGYGPVSWPSRDGGRTAYGVRAAGSWRGWDVAVSWYDGPSDLPAYTVDVALDPDEDAVRGDVGRTFYRLRSVGADFATVLGSLGVHGEGAWIDPDEDPRIPLRARRSWLHWVLGVDHRVPGAVGDRTLFVVGEWSREAWPGNRGYPEALDLAHAFRNALLGRVRLARFAGSATELEGAYDLARDGWLFRIRGAWVPRPGLLLETTLDLPGGPGDSFLGTFRRNRRLHLRLSFEL